MKNPILLSAGIALTLASCASDADTAARKKSVTIGRFGVIHNAASTAADTTAAVPTEGAPADPNVAAAQQQAAVPQPAKPEPTKAVAKEPAKPKGQNTATNGDGIRLPSMLGLPEDKDLKATNPTVPKSNEGGAVISRPPAEKKD